MIKILSGIAKDGHDGEWLALEVIRKVIKTDGPAMQVDWIFPLSGKYYLVEVKHQEIFTPPPFYGHGLPKWQIRSRLKFYQDTGIRPILIVIEKPMKEIYIQYLDKLNSNENNYFDTNGKKPRRIYNINKFKNITNKCKELNII